MRNKKQSTTDMPDIGSAASAYDCTGLMPTPPNDEDEMQSYQELYGMEIPKVQDQPD